MNNTSKVDSRKMAVSFSAIDQYAESNIILPTETNIASKDMVEWGDRNIYPYYLLELYNSVPTLRSIINGNIDFICGDDITILPLHDGFANGKMNTKGDTINDVVREIARNIETYGGFALQIIRDHAGRVAEIYPVDMRYIRTNKECSVFYYSEKWDGKGRKEVCVYPKFMSVLPWDTMTEEERNAHASSIFYYKLTNTQVYPAPLYGASIKACEIERCIDDYHLNAINNGFVSSMVVNFNSGCPTPEIQEEIEEEFNEKFCGTQNSGRVLFSWNKNRESATTFEYPKIEDFGEKYQSLSKHSRQQIFTAFRAIPALFGLMTETTGFSEQEFASAWTLYSRTQIRPMQRIIADAFDKIYGLKGVMTITPFSTEESTTTEEEKVN